MADPRSQPRQTHTLSLGVSRAPKSNFMKNQGESYCQFSLRPLWRMISQMVIFIISEHLTQQNPPINSHQTTIQTFPEPLATPILLREVRALNLLTFLYHQGIRLDIKMFQKKEQMVPLMLEPGALLGKCGLLIPGRCPLPHRRAVKIFLNVCFHIHLQ